MRIAVVGATGRIGAQLTRSLLKAGHEVKALSRGGPSLDALVKLGAQPCVGSFDTGTGDFGQLFKDCEAAFLMVKTDWNNIHGHYPAVADRFVNALRNSPVKLAVSLTAIGSEVKGSTGHFESFYMLDEILNQLEHVNLVHLRASWFMENLLKYTDAVAKYGRIGWNFNADLKIPWIATHDIAYLAERELTQPTGEHRVIREVGAEDLTMTEVAAMIGKEIGRPVEYRFVDRKRKDVEAEYLKRFGTPELWLDHSQTVDSLNDGVVRFHGERSPLPTSMESFIRNVWKPAYLQAVAAGNYADSFQMWCSQQ
ncbi:MAG: NmrA family NAD(P)-binding protein [Pseudomonadota bacterium]